MPGMEMLIFGQSRISFLEWVWTRRTPKWRVLLTMEHQVDNHTSKEVSLYYVRKFWRDIRLPLPQFRDLCTGIASIL